MNTFSSGKLLRISLHLKWWSLRQCYAYHKVWARMTPIEYDNKVHFRSHSISFIALFCPTHSSCVFSMTFLGEVWSHIRMRKLTLCWTQCNPFCMNKSSQIRIGTLLVVNMREIARMCTRTTYYVHTVPNQIRFWKSKCSPIVERMGERINRFRWINSWTIHGNFSYFSINCKTL